MSSAVNIRAWWQHIVYSVAKYVDLVQYKIPELSGRGWRGLGVVDEKSQIKRQGFGFFGAFVFYLATLLVLDRVRLDAVIG